MEDIKNHPRARVVDADQFGNPIYSTRGSRTDLEIGAKIIELWVTVYRYSISDVAKHMGLPENTVSQYTGYYLFKRLDDDHTVIRLKSNV